jgi:hypothetical protein
MTTLVSAIEVGSVRSLLPVCLELVRLGEALLIEERGHFIEEKLLSLSHSLVQLPEHEKDLQCWLLQQQVETVLFSVNVHDIRPLQIARAAQTLGIPTLHVLDYWGGYRSRMELDGGVLFSPNDYLVPDLFARNQAIEEGIDAKLISVAGQPAFAEWEAVYQVLVQRNAPFFLQRQEGYKVVLFVAEPAAKDQGRSLQENSNYRGYVEDDALQILVDALRGGENNKIWVCVAPHPRQDVEALNKVWCSLGGEQYGQIITGRRGRDLLPFVEGVAGMASTLLYEAWLVGKSVISIQPGLLGKSDRMMEHKEGVEFVDSNESAVEQTERWLSHLPVTVSAQFSTELQLHKQAPAYIAAKVMEAQQKNKENRSDETCN